jgi:agmatine deiminase
MPAEWEPHLATWISWPHNRDSWPGKFETVEPIMCRAVQALVQSEPVFINVLNQEHEAHVRRLLQDTDDSDKLRYFHFPTNDAWCRDHGAIFVRRYHDDGRAEIAAIDCDYNAWGGKYPPYDLDQRMPQRMAEVLGVRRFDAGMILEGGSIEVNGAGLLLTTEQCLLNPNRNPHLSRANIEQRLMALFGVERVLWLGEGIVGDDTDGHVDDLTRFVSVDTVVTVIENNPSDANHEALASNLIRLQSMTDLQGQVLHVRTLPMPAPVEYGGQRLPASYANFYIANEIVLLPVFNDPHDAEAIAVLSGCFPSRKIVPIDCTDLVWGLGAFHCLTQQVPLFAVPSTI